MGGGRPAAAAVEVREREGRSGGVAGECHGPVVALSVAVRAPDAPGVGAGALASGTRVRAQRRTTSSSAPGSTGRATRCRVDFETGPRSPVSRFTQPPTASSPSCDSGSANRAAATQPFMFAVPASMCTVRAQATVRFLPCARRKSGTADSSA